MNLKKIEYNIITYLDDPILVTETRGRISNEWPEFMLHDPVASNLTDCYSKFPQFQFVMVDPISENVVSLANSIPISYEGKIDDLPEDGWDWALQKGLEGKSKGNKPNILCALQIVIFSENRGRGISLHTANAMKNNGKMQGLKGMIAPVRPSKKSNYPEESIDDYIRRFRNDGLPDDPWLRVHARL